MILWYSVTFFLPKFVAKHTIHTIHFYGLLVAFASIFHVCWSFVHQLAHSSLITIVWDHSASATPCSSPSHFGGVGLFSIQYCTTAKLRNCMRYRQTINSYHKSNTIIYKHLIPVMFFLKILIILAIITTKLSKAFDFDGIMFTWTEHPIPMILIFWQNNEFKIWTNYNWKESVGSKLDLYW